MNRIVELLGKAEMNRHDATIWISFGDIKNIFPFVCSKAVVSFIGFPSRQHIYVKHLRTCTDLSYISECWAHR